MGDVCRGSEAFGLVLSRSEFPLEAAPVKDLEGMVKDEDYIIDLCDRVLCHTAIRQHRFDFLRGDTGHRLPVDAYYPNLKLVIEYRERQHFEHVSFWDKKPTASGVARGEQRALYDQRRRDVLPDHGIDLVELCCLDFQCDRGKRLLRDTANDVVVIRKKLTRWLDGR